MDRSHRVVPLVAAGFAISFMLVGGGINTAGVFLSAVALDTGWPRSVLSLALSVGAVVAAVSMPVVGTAVDRVGVRMPVAVGAGLIACGYGITASMGEPWHFIAANVFLGAGFGASALLPMTLAISILVPDRKALALGVAATGSSAGAFVMAPAVQVAIEHLGWRGAYVAMGVLAVAVPIVLVLSVLPRGRLPSPAAPDGAAMAGPSAAPAETPRLAALLLAGVMVLPGLVTFGLAVHLVPHLVASGLDQRAAAMTLGSAIGLSALGKLAGGWVADRIGLLATLRGALTCGVASIALLIAPPSVALLASFALLYGLYIGTTVAVIPAIALGILGAARFGSLFGLLQLTAMLAGAVGPIATGAVFDATGSYRNAILGWIIAMTAALGVSLLMRGVPAAPTDLAPAPTPAGGTDAAAASKPVSS